MARNLAQIVFLLYGFLLLRQTRKGIRRFLLRTHRQEEYYRNRNSFWRGLLFLPFQKSLPPSVFYSHSLATLLIPFSLAVSLLLGWFSFMALPSKLFTALSLILGGFSASLTVGINSQKERGRIFIFYQPASEKSDRGFPFVSTALDFSLTALLPLVMAISNFTL